MKIFRWKSKDDPYPHVKYTKHGVPYVDVDEILSGELGKELHEEMKLVRDLSNDTSDSSDKETTNE